MSVIFCAPQMTRQNCMTANDLFNYCRKNLEEYVADIIFVKSEAVLRQVLDENTHSNDILVFFNSDNKDYSNEVLQLIKKCSEAKSRIWPIAISKDCRKPPDIVSSRQSFDVSCWEENRYPLKNNISAIAQVISRKIIAQTLSPFYRDEVQYFISHRRSDGEHITSKLADKLKELNRERNVYRDVVNVAVGEDAQEDIDKNIALSDVVIFLQTNEASESKYIAKELCYAITNDIPVLWIQIDNASYDKLPIVPGKKPVLSYLSKEFDDEVRLQEIVDEIEDVCFRLMMFSSNQVHSYIDCLRELHKKRKIDMSIDHDAILSYGIQYDVETSDKYAEKRQMHYIQCFGRNPRSCDVEALASRADERELFSKYGHVFLLSNHGKIDNKNVSTSKVIQENYEDYIFNLENNCGIHHNSHHKRIIISGAFPDNDEIYSSSLMEALLIYCREIIKRGYILVFGSHPTFQDLIFKTARLYSSDVKYSVEMHMDSAYIGEYNRNDIEKSCTLILSNGLKNMRERMICLDKAELLICLGGKIKNDKSEQGVDIEIDLAKKTGIPVALIGTVGGRSSEYAWEMRDSDRWEWINDFDKQLNEELLCNVNHRLMAKRLLDRLEKDADNNDE